MSAKPTQLEIHTQNAAKRAERDGFPGFAAALRAALAPRPLLDPIPPTNAPTGHGWPRYGSFRLNEGDEAALDAVEYPKGQR